MEDWESFHNSGSLEIADKTTSMEMITKRFLEKT